MTLQAMPEAEDRNNLISEYFQGLGVTRYREHPGDADLYPISAISTELRAFANAREFLTTFPDGSNHRFVARKSSPIAITQVAGIVQPGVIALQPDYHLLEIPSDSLYIAYLNWSSIGETADPSQATWQINRRRQQLLRNNPELEHQLTELYGSQLNINDVLAISIQTDNLIFLG